MGNVSEWSELAVTAGKKTREKNYWLNRLSGDWVRSGFPCDSQESGKGTTRMKTMPMKLPGRISRQAIKLSKGADVRLHILLVAAVSLLLDKYTGNRDIIIGTPIEKQESRKELINSVLAVRSRLEGRMTFKQLILQVSQTIFEAVEHQNYPVKVLADQLNRADSDGGFPLFDIAVILENIHPVEYIRDIPLNMTFSFARRASEESIDINVEYNATYYSEDRVKRIIDHLNRLMEEVFFNLDVPLAEISVLSEEERNRQLYLFNSTAEKYPLEKTLHRLISEQVQGNPDKIAIISTEFIEGESGSRVNREFHLSYGELDRKSDQLACLLRERGVAAGTVVGVMLERSTAMVVGMLAIMKAGGAFLPISAVVPVGAKKFILEDSRVKAVLTQKTLFNEYREVLEGVSPVDILVVDDETIFESDFKSEALWGDLNLEMLKRTDRLLYIIYYSVGEGNPAGVMVEHSALINFIYSMNRNFNSNFSEGDRCLNFSDISLDVGVGELFLPLVFGAGVVLSPGEKLLDVGELSKTIVEKGITFSFIPPVLLGEVGVFIKEQYVGKGGKVILDKVLVGGEPIANEVLAEFQGLNPAMWILNGFGPPEATICSAVCRFTPALPADGNIPEGKPLDNTQLYVLNRDNQLYPLGSIGQLYISGGGLSIGYLNNPGLTADRFTNKKFCGGPGGGFSKEPPGRRRQRKYRTNDLVRWLEDGNIEYIKALGNQIEIRGNRIEPGEIEYRLLKHKKIEQALVIDRQAGGDEKYLCAYIVFGSRGEGAKQVPASAELVDFLSNHLPAFMIPRHFIEMENIPLTPNGKVDREALPEPQRIKEREYVAPGSQIEQKIAEIWKEVIKKDRVGVNDNFFEIGGNSLGILKLKNRLKGELEIEVPDIKFLEFPTIRTFYNYISREILGTEVAAGSDSREEIDPYKVDETGVNRLRLRKKILGNIVDV